ncbi:MAG: ABC transporter ATP-binding protein [Planctomycetes bacterium]|nr:ABC transporter ATP-binding protein [Planctomycetota bacterium]
MSEAGPLLAAQALDVGRRGVLLRAVDWELRAGEGWFVLGRNGSGKSTLVATLLGLLPALGGSRVAAPRLHQRLGYVPQELRFEPPLPVTVAEFVRLALPGTAAADAVPAALAAVGAGDLARRRFGALSVGQRRRVMVAQALAREPVLLVLDEPAANLDARAASALAADLERLRRERSLCVVHVAHDLALAQRYATHVAFVHEGRVAARPAAASWQDPALAATLAAEVETP